MPRRFLSLLLIVALLTACFFAEGLTAAAAEEEEVYDEAYDEEVAEDTITELKRGDRDQEDSSRILAMQNRLKELGYLSGSVDGVYGLDTEVAVRDFQQNNDLECTGTADVKTIEAIYNDEAVPAGEVNTESAVYRTQKMMVQWGFLEEDPDGRQGSNTNAAIVRFKEYLYSGYYNRNPKPTPEVQATPVPEVITGFGDGMVADDIPLKTLADVDVTEEIDQEVLDFVDGIYNFNTYSVSVASGESGTEVERVQRRLHQLKYLAIVNGTFDSATARALLYFQKVNDLSQNGVADEATQRRLFSEAAIATEEYVNPYKIYVDISDQHVYVYQWDGNGYGIPLKKFICSTGKKGKETETPLGTFSAVGPSGTGLWYYFKKFKQYAKWGYFIVGGIMFHSVIYTKDKKLIKGTVSNLGRPASHGCIRLEIENAKWIYDNCPPGTTVVIQK